MAKPVKNKRKPTQHPTNGWDMLTNVFIASMNKGQFPAAIIGLIVFAVILKLPPDEVSRLAFEIKEDLASGALVGYVVAFFTTTGWLIHARWQRQIISVEMHRIGQEKSQIQTNTFEVGVKSSNQ